MKKFANSALAYALVAMVCGVFYREFTKFSGFTGTTSLSLLHTHYFVLGVGAFLLLLLLERAFSFTVPATRRVMAVYHVGLNITGTAFLVRGLMQVLVEEPSAALDASISGVAGIGHIMLGVAMVMLLLEIRQAVPNEMVPKSGAPRR